MNQAAEFLKECGTFYLATCDAERPRVRPFGAVTEFEGKTYICTNNTKDCFKQMIKNPRVEISGMKGGEWIRISGEVRCDPRSEAKAAMLAAMPSLKTMYQADDGIFEVLYLSNAIATISSFTNEPESFVLT